MIRSQSRSSYQPEGLNLGHLIYISVLLFRCFFLRSVLLGARIPSSPAIPRPAKPGNKYMLARPRFGLNGRNRPFKGGIGP